MSDKESKPGRAAWWLWGGVTGIVIVLAVLIGMGVCERRAAAGSRAEPVETESKTVRVRVRKVERARIEDVLELPGILEAYSVAELGAERAGRIVELPVDKGAKVAAGDVLLRLDSRAAEQTVRETEIVFREAEKEWARWKDLQASGAVSASDSDAVRKGRDLAEIAVEQARIQLSKCEVRAPLAGFVDARPVEVGEFVTEGQAVFRVADTDRLKLMLNIPEMDVHAITPGQEVRFRAPAAGDQEHVGVVSFVSATATAGSHSYRTEALVGQPGAALKPGMIANVLLVRRTLDDAIVAPLSAVVPRKGEHIVFVVENGHAVRRTARIRSIMGQNVVLASGLGPGETLVVEGQRALQDGAAVEIEEETDRR